jgi:hypothetical protein
MRCSNIIIPQLLKTWILTTNFNILLMFYSKKNTGIQMLIVYQLTGNIKKVPAGGHSVDCNIQTNSANK